MSFRTPLKTNIINQSQSPYTNNSNSSTRLSSIKKVLNSDQQVETYKKNRSVTFQNSLNNINIVNFNNESLVGTKSQPKFLMNNLNDKQNENISVNSAIKEIVQYASDSKYLIYQNQIDRQKQSSQNLFHTQNRFLKKKPHCPNDLACSHKHIEQNQIQVNQKPNKRSLGEYNYEQSQKMILQDQQSNQKLNYQIVKNSQNTISKCLEDQKVQNISEEEILQNLLNSARAISSKTFLKIQASMKPHPVLISYCLSFIYIYKDYLQISDCKLKKLENNWREIQDIFQHHAPLIQALDSIDTQIQQQRINTDNINKSKEQIQKTEFIIDTIKNTQIFTDIVQPIQNFIKQCEYAINFYNRKYDTKNRNNQSDSNKNIQFNRLDQIVQIQQKMPKFSQNFQNDQMRRNTYAHINQSQESGENQIDDELREFTIDLSPIQYKNSKNQINQFSLQKQLAQQPINSNKTHKRRQSENIFNINSQNNYQNDNHKLNQNFIPQLSQNFNPQLSQNFDNLESQNLSKLQNQNQKNKMNYNQKHQLNDSDAEQVTYPLDQLQMDYYKKIKKYIKRMEEIEKIKEELWNI
ncbi:hypothetical protein TTHERM_00316950 (macronuclear) [Tetrahymena thermophila SB210]|uniref:Uncharacterized protein n=1 Tax=Tetrahymena thermophila (strain SB210) TaxID=312017 RepID=I7MG61_TETTS|nr:hypothetical protein TTHERM_00316950 [Tetrahymena thermophila SB210]EAS01131.2 hypothetical protein TTHERM_00316950 [Tetrahymena thermophila SB210]|eukprot:XP_001021376.2 hypothetical protein TTHERM_00316950 [Tetrahymena thermophila SB210]